MTRSVTAIVYPSLAMRLIIGTTASILSLPCFVTLSASFDAGVSLLCRTCFFNTRLYQELNPEEELPPHVDCPCCVLDIYEKTNATNEDGARCRLSKMGIACLFAGVIMLKR